MKREDRKSKAFISPGYVSKNSCEWVSGLLFSFMIRRL